MKSFLRLLAIALILLPVVAHGAIGTCTSSNVIGGTITTVTISCTGGTAGEAGTVTDLAIGPYRGWIVAVETNPGSTGPTDNYDMVLNNAASRDVMAGALANRSTSATQLATPAAIGWVDGLLTLVVTNNSVASSTWALKILIYREP